MEDISIYIHVPFCERKCHYCAFNSFSADDTLKDNYISLLCDEIIRRKVERPVKTIYIGGGTPSILSEDQIEKIIKTLYDNYNIYEDAEFTIEANPSSITEELLKKWKKLRVNRISIGVQSLNNKALRKIGRLHNKELAIEKIKLTRKYFDNVSVDLLVGLEKEHDLRRYAREFLMLGVKHISCYLLEVYENTKLHQMIKFGEYTPLNDDEMIAAFNKLSNYLRDASMERYEISNFAFEGYESKHNLNYWSRGDYLGFGLSAYSFVDDTRWNNASTMEEYKTNITQYERLSEKEQIEEIIMLGLRCKLGVKLSELEKLGYDITLNAYYKDYIMQGILKQKDDVLQLNPVYYHLSNTIISNLMP